MPPSPHFAGNVECVACAIITVSDTRTRENDTSGRLIAELLAAAGHTVLGHEIIPDEPDRVRERVLHYCCERECRAVLLTGGTGLSARDTTYEALGGLFEKSIEGFGELFRMLSFEEVGAAAMFSRATAGVRGATAIFSMPGSTAAVRLAMEKLIVPQLPHVAGLLRKGPD